MGRNCLALIKAQLNFSDPWENISTLWQYLLLQLYKTLPNLTLPNQLSIPFPNPAGGTLTLALLGAILPTPVTQTPFKISCQITF